VSQSSDKPNPFDPLSFWRTTQDATLESWSKTMIDLVNSEPYAEATARVLDSYLAVSAPVRKLLTQTMAQVLTQLNMPTEAEVTSLAERLTNIEMRLDDLDARLDTILDKLALVVQATTASAQPMPAAASAAQRRARSAAQPAAATATNGARRGGAGGARAAAGNGRPARRRSRAAEEASERPADGASEVTP
jgi:hypothetical protein